MYALLRLIPRLIATVYLVGLFRVRGAENVPSSGPLLVCANHISTIDPPLMPAVLPRSDSWSMAKSEYFAPKRWFVSRLFSAYHGFPVVRHTADRAALRRALGILARGHALILYPEGTRVDEARLREPEQGVSFLARRSHALLLPVGITGTNDCWPKGALWPRRKPVTVSFGRPFRLAEAYPDGRRVTRLQASEAIMVAIAELLPEANRGVFSDLERRRPSVQDLYLYADSQASPGTRSAPS